MGVIFFAPDDTNSLLFEGFVDFFVFPMFLFFRRQIES
jgi:hypothetical protein